MKEKKYLNVEINEKPKPALWFFMSFQHIFAMFGATVAVPLALGLPVSVALFASGIGTIIYIICTKAKVPVYLGSSFAYLPALLMTKEAMGGDISAGQSGLILVGLAYIVIALIIKFVGKEWLFKLLPPIVIGPMIIIIGLGLAGYACSSAGLVAGGDYRNMVVALVAFVTTVTVSTKAKGFLKIVPFLIGIVAGYATAVALGLVDFTPVIEAPWFGLPDFYFPIQIGNFKTFDFRITPEALAFLPIVLVTVSEHIGDHTVLGQICNKNFLKDPGLDNTLIGDGIATAVSAFLGGPANTTYGENTGVIGLTKIGSIYVVGGAACLAIFMSFFTKLTTMIQTIPMAVIGGMSIILYGVIAGNGLRVLIDNQVDFSKTRNLLIASAMLVTGLGGAAVNLSVVTLSGTALSAIIGIILNLVLPKE